MIFFPRRSSARFLGGWETRKVLSPRHGGLLLDGRRQRLREEHSFEHVALFARTGGGKTSRYIIPNLLTLDHCSMVVTDPSGEIHQKVSGWLRRQGFAIRALRLGDPSRSLRYNPLAKAKTPLQISEIAHVLVRSANPDYDRAPFWYGGAETLLDALMQCLGNAGDPDFVNLPNLLRLLGRFGECGEGVKDFVARYGAPHVIEQFHGFLTGNPRIIQSFVSVAVNSLRKVGNPDLAALLAGDDLNFAELRRRKTAVFLIAPSEKLGFYSFILNLFYTQFFHACMERLPAPEDLPVYALCDEFGHAAIPHFSSIITTIRKYRVSISIILQSLAQLQAQYGEYEARAILEGGVTSKIFFPGADMETARMVEGMMGKVRKQYAMNSGETAYKEENLMNADRVRTLRDDRAILFFANREPILLKTKPYFRQGKFRRAVECGAHDDGLARENVPPRYLPLSPEIPESTPKYRAIA